VLKPVLHVDRFADNVLWLGGKTIQTGINRFADDANKTK